MTAGAGMTVCAWCANLATGELEIQPASIPLNESALGLLGQLVALGEENR